MKMAAFWVVVPCSLIEVTDVSEVLAASIALMIQEKIASEMSANFYQTTRRNNPEDSHLNNLSCPECIFLDPVVI
jgi:hypothetical protein